MLVVVLLLGIFCFVCFINFMSISFYVIPYFRKDLDEKSFFCSSGESLSIQRIKESYQFMNLKHNLNPSSINITRLKFYLNHNRKIYCFCKNNQNEGKKDLINTINIICSSFNQDTHLTKFMYIIAIAIFLGTQFLLRWVIVYLINKIPFKNTKIQSFMRVLFLLIGLISNGVVIQLLNICSSITVCLSYKLYKSRIF